MVQSEQIICKVAFWYFRRMALMFLLLTGGGAWFYYDGLINWPNKNKIYLAKIAFEAGSEKRQWDDFTREIDKYDTVLSIRDIELIKMFSRMANSPCSGLNMRYQHRAKGLLQILN